MHRETAQKRSPRANAFGASAFCAAAAACLSILTPNVLLGVLFLLSVLIIGLALIVRRMASLTRI